MKFLPSRNFITFSKIIQYHRIIRKNIRNEEPAFNYILWVMFEFIQKKRLTGPVVYSNNAATFWTLSIGLNKRSESCGKSFHLLILTLYL